MLVASVIDLRRELVFDKTSVQNYTGIVFWLDDLLSSSIKEYVILSELLPSKDHSVISKVSDKKGSKRLNALINREIEKRKVYNRGFTSSIIAFNSE